MLKITSSIFFFFVINLLFISSFEFHFHLPLQYLRISSLYSEFSEVLFYLTILFEVNNFFLETVKYCPEIISIKKKLTYSTALSKNTLIIQNISILVYCSQC